MQKISEAGQAGTLPAQRQLWKLGRPKFGGCDADGWILGRLGR